MTIICLALGDWALGSYVMPRKAYSRVLIWRRGRLTNKGMWGLAEEVTGELPETLHVAVCMDKRTSRAYNSNPTSPKYCTALTVPCQDALDAPEGGAACLAHSIRCVNVDASGPALSRAEPLLEYVARECKRATLGIMAYVLYWPDCTSQRP